MITQVSCERSVANEPVLVWRCAGPRLMLSSSSVGGGLGIREWVVNVEVDKGYDRTDLATHIRSISDGFGLSGPGVGLLTAARVGDWAAANHSGARAWSTVGVSWPTWAAEAIGDRVEPDNGPGPAPGTINVVVELPVRCAPACLVNLIITATEAKTQALQEHGVAGTGTASDAVVVMCPPDGPEEAFGGPRSRWGALVANAVHETVAEGLGACQ
ncbi:MAG: adenosylcobinamide amidohydrolase [Acidimicrobiales bacterium]